ncbi:hypothetical protein ACFU44_18385 [Nocardia rhizosphaerihabitans]|uniref:hypothetical protein n=1 Tax=Nocardia rhizosphaerihabitans TaxID=1691570 RepID=UPI00366E4D64
MGTDKGRAADSRCDTGAARPGSNPSAIAQDDEQTGRTTVIVHSAPTKAFTIGQPRRVVQVHRSCDRTICPRKMAAVNVLVAAGVMRLDRRVGY